MMKLLLSLALLAAASCTHLNSVSVTSIPKDRSQRVSAERYKFLFLLLNFNNDFASHMEKDLAEKCPNGKVEGIVTKTEMLTYFPLIAHAYNIRADGYCIKK